LMQYDAEFVLLIQTWLFASHCLSCMALRNFDL
jgi:hypothetical protein